MASGIKMEFGGVLKRAMAVVQHERAGRTGRDAMILPMISRPDVQFSAEHFRSL